MNKSYQVLHMEPRASIPSGLNRHITRQQFEMVGETRVVTEWVPANADPNKTKGNVELVTRKAKNEEGKNLELTLQEAVDRRVKQAGIKPRKGQARCLEIIFTGSHDTMIAMDRKKLLEWAKETVKWSQDTWGTENVVSAVLHVDEKTPHIHMIVVPIVNGQSRRTKHHQGTGKSKKKYKIDHNKLRLCMSEVYTSGKLYGYHDSYALVVSNKYGMERGTKAEPGSKVRHQDSEDYNRQIAEEAAEQRALIAEIQADYAELQTLKDTLSSAVEEEQKKFDAAEAKTKQAEERLTSQQEKIEKNTGIINNQVADLDARKEVLEQTNTDIAANKKNLAWQTQTISANEATIHKQEKLKSSTIISDDAADRKILEKLQDLSNLEVEELRLRRSIINKKTELAKVNANLQTRIRMIGAKADLDNVPRKGLMGYKTEEVTAFIESVEMASYKEAMRWTPTDIKVDSAILEENARLRKIEDDYKDFMNSQEMMQQRIEYLKNESIRIRITETLIYVIRKPVKVIRFTVDKTPKGDDIFVKFTIEGNSTQWAGRITPDEIIGYTEKPLKSLQELEEHQQDKIWRFVGSLSAIRAKREKEDILSRYSTKLTMLTKEEVKVNDYVADGNHYLLFASNGRVYEVQPNGSTMSANALRVKTLDDCRRLSSQDIWKKHGNINNPKTSHGAHL